MVVKKKEKPDRSGLLKRKEGKELNAANNPEIARLIQKIDFK